MGNEAQKALWSDTFEDALRVAVEAIGPKNMAGELFPEKPVQQAAQLLWHCLDPERGEKLAASQIALIIRRGREAGSHAPMHFLAAEANYETPQPVEPEDERARLQRAFVESVRELRSIEQRLEKIDG